MSAESNQRIPSNTFSHAEQLQMLIECVHDYALLMLDANGIVYTWNSGAEFMYGYTAEEIIGQHFSCFYLPEDISRGKPERELREAKALGRFEDTGWRVRKDGSKFHATNIFAAINDKDGVLRGFGKVTCDTTERKGFETKIAELLEFAPDAIVIVDRSEIIILVNRQTEILFGYTREELVGQKLGILVPNRFDVAHHGHVHAYFAHPVTRRMGAGIELFGLRKDGLEFPVDIALATHDDGGDVKVIAAIRDISDKVNARKRSALESRDEQVQRLESLGQLAGGVAHDFNNLLAIILNYADFVEQELYNPKAVREDVNEIRKAAQRAARLTHQLLIFGRRDLVHAESLELNAIVNDSLTLLKTAVGESIVIHFLMAENLPRVWVDPTQIEQVLLNLAVNSRDAMVSGGELIIESSLYIVPDEDSAQMKLAPGQYVCLSVRDAGVGMSKETLSHVFEPFFTTKAKGHGTGLGLATVYGVAKNAGGDVSIYSEPGIGTNVRVYFPVTDIATNVETPASKPLPLVEGKTILIVEDEPQVQQLAKRVLEQNGYRVFIAGTPLDALSILEDHGSIDLLLTDVIMPGLSGPELAAQVLEAFPRTRILYMSGFPEDVYSKGADYKPFTLLEKPFSAVELLESVATIFLDATGEFNSTPEDA